MSETLTSEIPDVLHREGRLLLADALDMLDQVQALLRRNSRLEATSVVLCEGREDDEGCIAYQWDQATGVGPAGCVLLAISDLIQKETGSCGGYLDGKSAWELRQMFAHLLD